MKKQNRSGMLWLLLVVLAGCDVLAGMEAPILDEPQQPEPQPPEPKPSTCGNDVLDGTETDKNCGGDCQPCDTGKTCKVSGDCLSKICKAEACEVPRCDDQVQNGDESDIDCGGSCMQKCDDGKLCVVGEDCSSLVCTGGVCQVPMCGDGVVHANLGEVCDDGDLIDNRCGASCTVVQEVVKIAGGGYHTCALLNDGRVKCWGRNDTGQLGQGDTNTRGDGPDEMGETLPAIDLGTGKSASAIAVGLVHTCALLNDGSVKCWGTNSGGQLGQGDANNRGDNMNEMGDNLPAINLGTGKTASAIAAGFIHTCALLNDGNVKCWGNNIYGQLGLGDKFTRGDKDVPYDMGDNLPAIDLGTGKTASAIAAGGAHTCALLNDGSIKCWGHNGAGQLGQGVDTNNRGDDMNEMGDSLDAINLGTGKTASVIAAGELHTCALLNDGSVKCWGNNVFGQLGQGDTNERGDGPGEMGDSLPAINLGTGKTASAIAAGYGHTCALQNDGSVKCWGYNGFGQLGQGDKNDRGDGPGEMGDSLPAINLGTDKTASAIATGYVYTCALLNDGSVKCWGRNNYGQLGLGDTTNRGDQLNQMGDALPSVKLFSSVW